MLGWIVPPPMVNTEAKIVLATRTLANQQLKSSAHRGVKLVLVVGKSDMVGVKLPMVLRGDFLGGTRASPMANGHHGTT